MRNNVACAAERRKACGRLIVILSASIGDTHINEKYWLARRKIEITRRVIWLRQLGNAMHKASHYHLLRAFAWHRRPSALALTSGVNKCCSTVITWRNQMAAFMILSLLSWRVCACWLVIARYIEAVRAVSINYFICSHRAYRRFARTFEISMAKRQATYLFRPEIISAAVVSGGCHPDGNWGSISW